MKIENHIKFRGLVVGIYAIYFPLAFSLCFIKAKLEIHELTRLEMENGGKIVAVREGKNSAWSSRTLDVMFALQMREQPRFLNKTAVVARTWPIRGNLIVLNGVHTNFPTFSLNQSTNIVRWKVISRINRWDIRTPVQIWIYEKREREIW